MPLVYIPALQVRLRGRKLTQAAIKKFGDQAPKVVRATFKQASQNIAEKMQVPGKPITYPVKWDSDKQRRAFFATNGFGGGIPHVRQNVYVGAWQQKTIRGGYQVSNKLKYAGYIAGDIYGNRQSRIHRGRWPVFRRVVDKALKGISKKLLTALTVTATKIGFRVK